MKLRTTVGLAAALVVLCGLYWVLVSMEQQTKVRQDEAKLVFPYAPQDVSQMRIDLLDEDPVAATRNTEGVWSISEPFPTIPADQSVWDRMAGKVVELANERTVEEGAKDLEPYGLKDPVLTLEAKTVAGDALKISFGALEPTQSKRYALTDDGRVFLVLEKTYREFDRTLTNLRERQLVEVGDQGITWLRFARLRPADGDKKQGGQAPLLAPETKVQAEESVPVELKRDADGRWHMMAPVVALADQEKASALVTELQYAVGRDYVDAPSSLADYGLNPPGARIAVRSGEGPEQVIDLGWMSAADAQNKGGLYVKQEAYPSVFLIDAHLLTLLPKAPDEFRDKHLFTGEVSKINEIRYTSGDTHMVLANDPVKGWRVGVPAAGEVRWFDDTDQASVSAFLSSLKILEVAEFVDPDTVQGLDDPRIAIDVTYEDGATGSIKVGARRPDGDPQRNYYYALQDTGVPAVIGAFQANILSKSPFTFRDKRLLHFSPDDVAALELDVDGTVYRVEKDGEWWRLTAPESRRLPNASDVTSLLTTLQKAGAVELEAKDAPDDLTPFKLAPPAIRVTLELAGDAKRVGPLSIGGVAPDDSSMRFATVAGRPEVFRVKQDLVDALRDAVKAFQATSQ